MKRKKQTGSSIEPVQSNDEARESSLYAKLRSKHTHERRKASAPYIVFQGGRRSRCMAVGGTTAWNSQGGRSTT